MAPERSAPLSQRFSVLADDSVIPVNGMQPLTVDVSYGTFAALITPDGYSPKTDKGHARNVATAILYLAPSDASGVANTCVDASEACRIACLYKAGRGGFDIEVNAARINRTRMLKFDRFAFNRRLIAETGRHERRAARKSMECAERLNGTSDLPWESFVVDADGHTMMALFPNVQFYDYTKSLRRALKWARGDMPANYHLTFSRSESNHAECVAAAEAGCNIAVVFRICKCAPKAACRHEIADGTYTYLGRPVINGDHDDLRYKDPRGVVVGLKAKGPARADTSGFVVDISECGRVEVAA